MARILHLGTVGSEENAFANSFGWCTSTSCNSTVKTRAATRAPSSAGGVIGLTGL
jgi:hypothetical protein